MPTFTRKRPNAADPIHIEMSVFNPITGRAASAIGLFDTGNDHTIISKEVSDSIGITAYGRTLPVYGVTGTSEGQTARVTFGINFDESKKVAIVEHEVLVLTDTSSPILIGRDFLERFDVKLTRNGLFTLEC